MKNYKQKKGSVLALIVILILLMSLSCMALIALAQEARLRSVKNVLGISARFAADAGVERTLYQMNKDLEAGTWVPNNVPTYTAEPLAGCNAKYTVTFEGDLASGYRVTSVGKCGIESRTVRATIELSNPFANDFAILTDGHLEMRNIAIVKGFNSDDPTDTSVQAAIGTQSTLPGSIFVDMEAQVFGDAYIGTGGDPDQVVVVQKPDSITGEIFVMPAKLNLPKITAPDFPFSKGVISGSNVILKEPDSGKYTKVDIPAQGKITIDGDVVIYITGDVVLDNQSVLEIPVGSSLKLYFDGDFHLRNSAEIHNLSLVPDAVRLYGTGKSQFIEMRNSTDIYAIVYAPNADMCIFNEVCSYGCFIVDTFEMENGGELYYDSALKGTTLDDELIYFTVTNWEEL